MTLRHLLMGALTALMFGQALAQPQPLDEVAVLVNDGVILKSEIDERMTSVKRSALQAGQQLPSDAALRTQVIDRLIAESLQLQMAERMGLVISDIQLDQTLENMAREQGMTLQGLRQEIESDGSSYAAYREQVRREITIGQVQRIQVQRRIQISPQEINTLVDLINEQGLQNAEFHVGHILIDFAGDEAGARERADKVLELLNDGADFAKTALAASSGPKALEGGDWGYMNINEMPTLFAEVVKDAKKGDIIGPIKSGAGFHIVTIYDTRGQEVQEVAEVNARHILLKPSPILSEEMAKTLLDEFMADVKAGKTDFADLARQHSDDPGSATRGGDLGWADPNMYVPAFRDTLARLKVGEYSEPFRSTHGWHVVQLLDRRVTDATSQANTDRAYQLLFRRKFGEQVNAWQEEMRAGAYIEVLERSGRRS
ncbi:peptidylprolyl isomerase SurA [Ferrimonas balearica]|uniref:peptidylprolyl isomerase SurA n=1 Tax=Ferrimonas balearica TaxID=44012 RepID=UPI001C99E7D1|nr:peptidylprolyl isomerase SurA [Ferrimonas balearica]MBY5922392.1 peptidylprolyl isomerase SurA [Ferrimonas balearica]MBY5995376.1 peptidylprolyl isomerase SurA [Ferrimonas balearica]